MEETERSSKSGMPAPLPTDLPPVQPPSSGFFVQLFVLPALIVFGIVFVWFLFGRLAGDHRTPDDYLAILRDPSRGDRWKAAMDLSQILRENSSFTRDNELAEKVAKELTLAVEQKATMDEARAKHLEFLAGACGSFHTSVGMAPLTQACRADFPVEVRRAAMIAVTRLIDRNGPADNPGLRKDLAEYLGEDNSEIRELAAFTLGFIGDQTSLPALEGALGDPKHTVRFNAASALAKLGSASCLPVLAQMMNQTELEKIFQGPDGTIDQLTVSMALAQSIQSVVDLKKKSPPTDFAVVSSPLQALASNGNAKVAVDAREAIKLLQSPQ